MKTHSVGHFAGEAAMIPFVFNCSIEIPKTISGDYNNITIPLIRKAIISQVAHAFSNWMDESRIINDEDVRDKLWRSFCKSPAFYGITSDFSMQEYIKNSCDVSASRADICFFAKLNDEEKVSDESPQMDIVCMYMDNGTGFINPSKGFGRELHNKQEGTDTLPVLNYREDVLKGHSSIASTKQKIPGTAGLKAPTGGAGKGLAFVSHDLNAGGGKLELTDRSYLAMRPGESIQAEMISHLPTDFLFARQGAAIICSSREFNEETDTRLKEHFGVAKFGPAELRNIEKNGSAGAKYLLYTKKADKLDYSLEMMKDNLEQNLSMLENRNPIRIISNRDSEEKPNAEDSKQGLFSARKTSDDSPDKPLSPRR